MKKDTIKILRGYTSRIEVLEEKMQVQRRCLYKGTYKKGEMIAPYFRLMELRNTTLNSAYCILREDCGMRFKEVRIHQENVLSETLQLLRTIEQLETGSKRAI